MSRKRFALFYVWAWRKREAVNYKKFAFLSQQKPFDRLSFYGYRKISKPARKEMKMLALSTSWFADELSTAKQVIATLKVMEIKPGVPTAEVSKGILFVRETLTQA